MVSEIEHFYQNNRFPGEYDDIKGIEHNPFVKSILDNIPKDAKWSVLDAGCGSGMIANRIAELRPNIRIDAIDISQTSLDIGEEYAKAHHLDNVNFRNYDLLDWQHEDYDFVYSIGVLHHIPSESLAIEKYKYFTANWGKLMLAVYNPYWKFAQKIVGRFISWPNETLREEQMEHPFERTYTQKQLTELFQDYTVTKVVQGKDNLRNGGLTLYDIKYNTNKKVW